MNRFGTGEKLTADNSSIKINPGPGTYSASVKETLKAYPKYRYGHIIIIVLVKVNVPNQLEKEVQDQVVTMFQPKWEMKEKNLRYQDIDHIQQINNKYQVQELIVVLQ